MQASTSPGEQQPSARLDRLLQTDHSHTMPARAQRLSNTLPRQSWSPWPRRVRLGLAITTGTALIVAGTLRLLWVAEYDRDPNLDLALSYEPDRLHGNLMLLSAIEPDMGRRLWRAYHLWKHTALGQRWPALLAELHRIGMHQEQAAPERRPRSSPQVVYRFHVEDDGVASAWAGHAGWQLVLFVHVEHLENPDGTVTGAWAALSLNPGAPASTIRANATRDGLVVASDFLEEELIVQEVGDAEYMVLDMQIAYVAMIGSISERMSGTSRPGYSVTATVTDQPPPTPPKRCLWLRLECTSGLDPVAGGWVWNRKSFVPRNERGPFERHGLWFHGGK